MNATTITTNVAGNIEINGVTYEPAELDAMWHQVMGTGSTEAVGPDGATSAREAVRGTDIELRHELDRSSGSWLVTEGQRVGILADANGWCVAWLTLEAQ